MMSSVCWTRLWEIDVVGHMCLAGCGTCWGVTGLKFLRDVKLGLWHYYTVNVHIGRFHIGSELHLFLWKLGAAFGFFLDAVDRVGLLCESWAAQSPVEAAQAICWAAKIDSVSAADASIICTGATIKLSTSYLQGFSIQRTTTNLRVLPQVQHLHIIKRSILVRIEVPYRLIMILIRSNDDLLRSILLFVYMPLWWGICRLVRLLIDNGPFWSTEGSTVDDAANRRFLLFPAWQIFAYWCRRLEIRDETSYLGLALSGAEAEFCHDVWHERGSIVAVPLLIMIIHFF